MSIALTVGVSRDDVSVPLARVGAALQRPDLRKVMGRAVAGGLRRHFSALDRSRANELGGRRTHFYADARRGVQQPELVGGDAVKVSVNHVGIAQRYFGGEITPKSGRYLTIPVHPEAYGRRAREFTDLEFIALEGKNPILARPGPEGGIGEVFYVLVRRVHQEPDPEVLPPPEDLEEAAVGAAQDYLQLLAQRASGGGGTS